MAKKLVKIDWEDSVSHTNVWIDKAWAKHADNDIITSVGYIQKHTKKEIVIASHIGSQQISGGMCIPASAVRKIKRLKGG